MNRMGPPNGSRCSLRQAEVADLTLRYQLSHCPHRVLDRHFRVYAMQIVEVDRVDAEPRKRCVTRGPHVLGTAIDSNECAIWLTFNSEFCCQHDSLAPPLQGARDQAFISKRTVRVGRIY